MKNYQEEISHIAHVPTVDEGHTPDFLNPEFQVLILTWVTFFLLLAVLRKFAWQPILNALDEREDSIRKSVEESEQIHQEMKELQDKKEAIIAQAEEKARGIIAEAKKGAQQVGKTIEMKAREDAQIIMENAEREISSQRDRAQEILKRESADFAVSLAEKILIKKLTDKDRQAFLDSALRDI